MMQWNFLARALPSSLAPKLNFPRAAREQPSSNSAQKFPFSKPFFVSRAQGKGGEGEDR